MYQTTTSLVPGTTSLVPEDGARFNAMKRKNNAKITQNNAKNNARITLNNLNFVGLCACILRTYCLS